MQQVALSFHRLPLNCISGDYIFSWHLSLHRFHPVAFMACSNFRAHTHAHLQAWMNWVTVSDWQLACVDPHPLISALLSHFLPAPLVHAAVWLVLPWHQCGQTEASHTASCVLFTEGPLTRLRCSDANTHGIRTQPCGLRTLQLCLTLMGSPSPVNTQQRDAHRLTDHVSWLFVWSTSSWPKIFFSFLLALRF